MSTPGSSPLPNLAPLLHAQSVAIVGAGPEGSFGGQILANLRRFGYPGRIFGVSRSLAEADGLRCYASLGELPERPDCVALAVGNARLEAALAEVAACAIPAAVIFASAFLPPEPGLPPLEERLARIARAAGIALLGPNCMGFVSFPARLGLAGYPLPGELPAGNIGLISQSGSIFSAILRGNRRLRFSYAVSSGNEAVVGLPDYGRAIVERPETEVLGLFLDAIRDPQGFVALLEAACARDLPIVALRVGRSRRGRELALAHSGRLAGQAEAYEALFRRYGVCACRSPDEFADTLELFGRLGRRRAPTRALATVHDSGGERALLADLAEDQGLAFAPLAPATVSTLESALEPGLAAENPLDVWGSGKAFHAVYDTCLAALDADPGVGALALAADFIRGGQLAYSYVEILRGRFPQLTKPFAVLVNVASGAGEEPLELLRELGIPVLMGSETGLRAIGHLLEYSAFQREYALSAPAARQPLSGAQRREPQGERWRVKLRSVGGPLDEAASLALLADYGLPTVRALAVASPAEALAAAGALGYPVALKTLGASHKSDADGVALNLGDAASLAAAYDALAARLGPQALVQPMVPGGVELLLGLTRDASFGWMLLIGFGGVLVELLADRQALLLPASAAEVRAALERLRGAALLRGLRGRPPVDLDAVVAAALALAALAEDLGAALEAVDVNPLIALPQGCLAVDALVVPRT
jgi:acetate---CoA ligase (ADP-forming)